MRKFIPETNDGIHLHQIIASTPCAHHNAELGEGCWSIFVGALESEAPAICGRRVKLAGYTGQISPKSLSLWSPSSPKPRPGFKAKFGAKLHSIK